MDAMLPALPHIGQSLQVEDPNDLQLVITLFIFGMFFGELFFGPLSDAIGRKNCLLVGVVIYCCGTLLSMFAPSLELLLGGRIIQGVGVSGPKIISRAMVRDQFSGNPMARVFSFILTVFICIPMVAPALGQGIASLWGWRVVFLFLLVVAVCSTAWIMVCQPETLPPEKRTRIRVGPVLRTSLLILSNRSVSCYATTAGLIFGILLLYLSTSQAMFAQIYGKDKSFPLYFAILSTGFGAAALLNSRLVFKYGMHRLCLVALIGLVLLGGFFFFGGEDGVVSFSLFMIGCYTLMFFLGLLFSNLTALAMQPLGGVAGLGASLVSAVSSIVAVAISVSCGRFYDNTLYVLISVLVVGALFSLILLFGAQRKQAETVDRYVL